MQVINHCFAYLLYGRIRHFLNDNLEANSGHIGYAIPSSHRGKGYGNELFALLLKECDKLKISIVLVRANRDNERSNRVIVHNGVFYLKNLCKKNIYIIYAEGYDIKCSCL